ncbi:MAG: glycoside hydrolase family 125 protein [Christensenellales bacterium]
MNYQVTGNEYVSLPTIRESDGAIEGISCLFMRLKGMLEMKGQGRFIQPYIELYGKQIAVSPVWSREHFWIPSFESTTNDFSFRCTYLAPIGERGFGLRLSVLNKDTAPHKFTIGVTGDWSQTLHTVNESICLDTGRMVKDSGWNHMFVFQQVPGIPLIAFAPIIGDNQPFSEIDQGAEWERRDYEYRIFKSATLPPDTSIQLDIFFGIGYEEVSAATSAKEMLRQGFDTLLQRTASWLYEREKRIDDPVIETLLNTNLFFSFFYASGRTIDTEELCMMTSRSPRYYVSAAYWDRDSLLWAFPAIVEADVCYARELLLSVFHLQGRNFGIHSRFIDGTVLEPGFELDELCAPVIALERYVQKTGDKGILQRAEIQESLTGILEKLNNRKHPEVDLYSTFLQPTDDMRLYPYLTYNNVLAWKTLNILSVWLNQPELAVRAEKVKKAIQTHCVHMHEGKPIYAWSVDLNGHWDIYDEPPGSLQLLPFYGFCEAEDSVWQNTVSLIRDKSYPLSFAGHHIAEIGCKHAPHPWVLSICNSLLAGFSKTALEHLRRTRMDNGVACESVDEDTGACVTGAAFATCAGFLAFALMRHYDEGMRSR